MRPDANYSNVVAFPVKNPPQNAATIRAFNWGDPVVLTQSGRIGWIMGGRKLDGHWTYSIQLDDGMRTVARQENLQPLSAPPGGRAA